MCGIAVIVGERVERESLERMNAVQIHRGPDAGGVWISEDRKCGLGHRRLSILDLSAAGAQPMADRSGRYVMTFNGEIYNYLELREALGGKSQFHSQSDSEVLLEAFVRWGRSCLDRLVGMFAFAVWDREEGRLFVARDRYGVKPLYYGLRADGAQVFASEIKALFAAGVPQVHSERAWANYLARGVYDQGESTFWEGVTRLEAGTFLEWQSDTGVRIGRWYDLPKRIQELGPDERAEETVIEDLLAGLEESVAWRFRSDVDVGVCLSGGLDSSLLFRLAAERQQGEAAVRCFTFACGDANYDETPWVEAMVAGTGSESVICPLRATDVPDLAVEAARIQDEPYGGIPTLGMIQVHRRAKQLGVTVLLDGNGLDETWAGYDYYQNADAPQDNTMPVQGSKTRPTRPECLNADFRELAELSPVQDEESDALRRLQYRDLLRTKIPRAMRFADRASMMEGRELREPFLDHRLVELGLRQSRDRKIRAGVGKWLVRRGAKRLIPGAVRTAPKRPVQTPQREWFRGPLRDWSTDMIDGCLRSGMGSWFQKKAVENAWRDYCDGQGDNSFWVWQWISLGLQLAVGQQPSRDPDVSGRP